ncbi:MAG: hypothetical protein R2720_11790 [Candidatus Nanopelagicales bacterium]
MNNNPAGTVRTVSPGRISTLVYAALSLLAIAAAATAKGYADTLAEFVFVVLVSAAGLVVAHLWSAVLARRLIDPASLTRARLSHEAVTSSTMALPGVLMAVVAWLSHLVSGRIETSVTVAMGVLVVVLFAYTWAGTTRGASRLSGLLWALGTAGVGALMIVFKVLV